MMPDHRVQNISSKQTLTTAAVMARFGIIAAVLFSVAGAFAYTGGWLSPNRLTQARAMAVFEQAGGRHPGFRRNHAKGVCVVGWFESNGQAVALSKAAVFKPGRIPIVGRFAISGDMPFQADKPATVRSMALRFMLPGAEEWRTGLNNVPVFVANSAQGFLDEVLASVPDPITGSPDPAKMKQFMADHPESVRAIAVIMKSPLSSGFADATFNSLNAFRMINAAGKSIPVRWATVPMQPFKSEEAGQAASSDQNYLFDDLTAQLGRQPLLWRLVITIGQPGDPTNDATLPWPADRQQVDAGTVTLDQASSEETGRCTDVNYDPLVLPPGIAPSDDPLLSARSAAYSRSFTLRAAEKDEKSPGAISPADIKTRGKL
jgi:catalase